MPTRLPARRSRILAAAFLLLAALLALGSGLESTGSSRPGPSRGHAAHLAGQVLTPHALARIDKAALAKLALDDVAGLRSVLELRRSWLAQS